MSHRVTTKTEIKDRTLAIQALKSAGMSYQEHGDTIRITSGRMANATLNLKTGDITGDSDYGHTGTTLGVIRQGYAEAKSRAEILKQGHTIYDRVAEKNGDVTLYCRMA